MRRRRPSILHLAAQSWFCDYVVTLSHAGILSNKSICSMGTCFQLACMQYSGFMHVHASRASGVIHVSLPFQLFAKHCRQVTAQV